MTLGSGQKADVSGIYTREGVFAGRASAAVDQTPADQFVASAVNILCDFDIGKSDFGGKTAFGSQVDVLSTSRFGSFKQAVAKLNVFV